MSIDPVFLDRDDSLELPVEELLHRARPLPSYEDMVIDDLDEAEGVAFLAILEA